MYFEDAMSMKVLMNDPSYIKERDNIINKTIFNYLDIGYIPVDTGEEIEGESLILVDDCIYLIGPWLDEFVVENFYNSIATDFKIDLHNQLLIYSLTQTDEVQIPITDETINNIQNYKSTYRTELSKSEILKELIIDLQKDSNVSTQIGLIIHSEDNSSLLPYQCFLMLLDNEVTVINIFINNDHNPEIEIYKNSISEVEIENNIIFINSYRLHSNKKFYISDNQISLINLHIDKIKLQKEKLSQQYQLEIDKEKEILNIIQHNAVKLTKESDTKELLTNFLLKYTNDYYKNLHNHCFDLTSISKNANLMPNSIADNINLLIKLFRNRGHISPDINSENDVYVIYFALQYMSIRFYSNRFQSNILEFTKDITDFTLTESLSYYFDKVGIKTIEINNEEIIHYLISEKTIDYNENLHEQLKEIEKVSLEYQENKTIDLFEKSLKSESSPLISIEMFDNMNGLEFEVFIMELFSRIGFKTEVTKASNDQGIDIIARNSIEAIGIQAKCYSIENRVSNKAVQEVHTGLNYYGLKKGIVVTTSYFTASAKELAQKNNIILWDRDHLEKYLQLYF